MWNWSMLLTYTLCPFYSCKWNCFKTEWNTWNPWQALGEKSSGITEGCWQNDGRAQEKKTASARGSGPRWIRVSPISCLKSEHWGPVTRYIEDLWLHLLTFPLTFKRVSFELEPWCLLTLPSHTMHTSPIKISLAPQDELVVILLENGAKGKS